MERRKNGQRWHTAYFIRGFCGLSCFLAASDGRSEALVRLCPLHRANALEEQLKEQELRADQTLLEEIKKQREMLSKMEREKSIEIENLQARCGRAGGVVAGLLGTWITSNQCRPRGLAASPPFPLSQNQAPPPAWPQTARISPLGFQFSSCSPSTAVPCSV